MPALDALNRDHQRTCARSRGIQQWRRGSQECDLPALTRTPERTKFTDSAMVAGRTHAVKVLGSAVRDEAVFVCELGEHSNLVAVLE